MKLAISVESTADCSKALQQQYDINVIAYTVTLGEKTALDGEITPKEIFDFVAKTNTLPRTSAINAYQFETYFQSLLDKGYTHILHFCLSSKMSSSYQNASEAAKKFDGKVAVIDSKILSTGITIQAIYARELSKDETLTLEDIVNKVEARKDCVYTSFVLSRLDYLYKGGRCSALARIGAAILGIRPQILVDDGAMRPNKKYRGKDNVVVKKYTEDVLKEFNNPDKKLAIITATNYNQEIYDLIEKILKEAGFATIYQTTAGATITSHCGDRTIGFVFYNDGGVQ